MLNPSDFPHFPTIDNKPKFNIDSTSLVRGIKKIAPAIDSNNPKFELNGALIDIRDNTINLVATDTKRLAIMKVEQPTLTNFSLIIPKKLSVKSKNSFLIKLKFFMMKILSLHNPATLHFLQNSHSERLNPMLQTTDIPIYLA